MPFRDWADQKNFHQKSHFVVSRELRISKMVVTKEMEQRMNSPKGRPKFSQQRAKSKAEGCQAAVALRELARCGQINCAD
jgi:hypothetical protein